MAEGKKHREVEASAKRRMASAVLRCAGTYLPRYLGRQAPFLRGFLPSIPPSFLPAPPAIRSRPRNPSNPWKPGKSAASRTKPDQTSAFSSSSSSSSSASLSLTR
ncbi:hypothetical protein LX36DRAFT_348595 [Colletotrichum falcatum]|nr:hypothetical protein LX36DRAFT_348595 [Colletotrichum falcatum]